MQKNKLEYKDYKKAATSENKPSPPALAIMIQNRLKDLFSLVALMILLNKAMEVGASPTKEALSEFI
jgi:hypothetical protein